MNDAQPQSTLRQWRCHIARPGVLAALAGFSAILGLAGPFGTGALLGVLPRLGYWAVLVVLTYSVGFFANVLLRPLLQERPVWVVLAATGLMTGLGASVVVLLVNLVVFRFFPKASELPGFVLVVTVVALIVTVLLELLDNQMNQTATFVPHARAAGTSPRILDRIPPDKRGALVSLSVEDHYVRIRTLRGEEMVLLRLSDAMRETGSVPGGQVHRSHWVAFDQVTQARRTGDRAILTMRVGPDIPVSRANLAKLREAGLLT